VRREGKREDQEEGERERKAAQPSLSKESVDFDAITSTSLLHLHPTDEREAGGEGGDSGAKREGGFRLPPLRFGNLAVPSEKKEGCGVVSESITCFIHEAQKRGRKEHGNGKNFDPEGAV